jgi:hypothetical protein
MNDDERQEVEDMIQEELERRQDEKRLLKMHGNNYEDDEDDRKDRGRWIKLPCCAFMLFILAISVYLIYYVSVKLKDPVYQEYLKGKEIIEQVPGKIEELNQAAKDQIDVGKNLVDETGYTIDKFEQKIDSAKNAYDKAQEITEDLKALNDYTKQAL